MKHAIFINLTKPLEARRLSIRERTDRLGEDVLPLVAGWLCEIQPGRAFRQGECSSHGQPYYEWLSSNHNCDHQNIEKARNHRF